MRERKRSRRAGHRFRAARESGMARLVSVGELLSRQPESLRSALPRPSGETVWPGHEHPRHDPGSPGPASPHPLVRLAAGVVAVFLLVGATSVTSVALSRDPTSSPHDSLARASPVTGMPALRPDLLMARAGWSPAEIPGPAREPVLPLPLPGSDRLPGPGNLLGEDSASLLRANPSAGSVQGAVALVEDFYRLLDRDPAGASALLAPRLLGSQTEEFTRSWNALRSVRARHVRPGPDGSVIGEVAATGPRGERVVLRHELTVTNRSTTSHIVTVELLKATLSHG